MSESLGAVGLVGAGVIGAGWAARFAINQIPLTIYDPDPAARRKVGEVLEQAQRAYQRLTLAPLPAPAPIVVTDDLERAVADAGFIQESAPERADLKRTLLGEISRLCRPGTLIATSTSGLLPTVLQADMRCPERLVVGHPFNPVYLMPLVELCGGAATVPETILRAEAVYRALGMHPLPVRREIDGFIADRLMEALWREALHLVNDGVATSAEIDEAIAYGPGLRWAFMGPFLTYRLAGGEGGMRHFLEQFGPSLTWPWCHMEAPPLTDDLIGRLAQQSDDQAEGRSIQDLVQIRDDCLVAILQGLRARGFAAGAVMQDYDQRLFGASHGRRMGPEDDLAAPLDLHTAEVLPAWVDYNGHMTESRYLQVFGDSTDAVLRYVGADTAYNSAGHSYYTVETHIMHLREVEAGAALRVRTQVLSADDRRLRLFHTMTRGDDGTALATAEHMMLHVDTRASRASPTLDPVKGNVLRLAVAHAGLPRPDAAGRGIGQRS